MKSRPVLAIVAGVVLAAAAIGLWFVSARAPAVRIAGMQSALPRASAESESVLPEALAAARAEAVRGGARALIVHRRGHRVFEYFASGRDGAEPVEGGELAAAVLALALH